MAEEKSTKNTIFGILDPGEILLSRDDEAPNLDPYGQAAQSAKDAKRFGAIIENGGYQQGDASGTRNSFVPVGTGKGVADVLGERVGPNTALDPAYNSYLRQQAGVASAAVGGQLGERFGSIQAGQGAAAAAQAASGVTAAGQPSIMAAQRQNGQMAQDLSLVRNSALGQGPSAAAELAKAQMDRSIAAQASQAAAARGGNVAAGMRAAMNSGEQVRLQTAQNMAAQRAQEQLNAQGVLTQGNASLGGVMNGTSTTATQSAASGANAVNDAARTATANFAANADLGQAGMNALGQAAGQQAAGVQAKDSAEARDANAYADWLQRQYSIASGIPVGYAGPQAQQNIANQQAQIQREGANKSAIGALLGGLLTA